MSEASHESGPPVRGLVLSGGGARGAYEAGVLAEASEAVGRHTEAALRHVQAIAESPAREALTELVERMRSRVH